MKFFTLLSVLASTAAANRAKDAFDDTWAKWGAGADISQNFADDAVIDCSVLDGYNFGGNGYNQVGVNGFTVQKWVDSLKAYTFYKFDLFDKMVSVDDDSKYSHIIRQWSKTPSGVRYSEDQLWVYTVNAEGKISNSYLRTLKGTNKLISAKAVATRALEAWTAGDMKAFFAVVHEDAVWVTDIGKTVGVTSMAGEYKGHAGVKELIQKQVEAIDFDYSTKADGTFNFVYNHVGSADDGKTAFLDYHLPLRYKNGAEYLTQFSTSWKVDDVGMIVDYRFFETSSIQTNAGPSDKKEL